LDATADPFKVNVTEARDAASQAAEIAEDILKAFAAAPGIAQSVAAAVPGSFGAQAFVTLVCTELMRAAQELRRTTAEHSKLLTMTADATEQSDQEQARRLFAVRDGGVA